MAHGQGGAEIGIDHGPTLTCNHEAPIVAHSLRAEGFDASEDGTGRGTPIVPVAMPLTAGMAKSASRMPHEQGALIPEPIAFDCLAGGETGLSIGEVPGALHGGGKSGGRAAIAFSSKDSGADAAEEVTPTLRAMGHADSHANAGGQMAVAIQERAVCENPDAGPDGKGWRDDGAAYTLEARTTTQAVAVPWAVRRLTPVECERLQGMPDDHTQIPWRGRNGAPDGPRYKALSNSMAVNAMEWIGERIAMVEELSRG